MSEEETTRVVLKKERKPSVGLLGIGLALIFALATFASGIKIGSGNDGSSQTAGLFNFLFPTEEVVTADSRPDMSEFWEIWELLEEYYVAASSTTEVTVEERIQGAIDGLVDTYDDPYTVYLPPKETTLFEEDVSGEFSGVGMEVGIRDGLVTVIAPLPDTPAAGAGLLAGDVIVRIDDVSTEGMRIDEAVRLIRGERGTPVDLTIYREGEVEFETITVIRDTIEIPTVRTSVDKDGIFYLELFSFNAISEEKMKEALAEYLANNEADKLIVDLRGNPGGFLQSAVSIGSYFLPSGKVIVTQESGNEKDREVFRSRSRLSTSPFKKEELVVLVDNGSASASEILAGALQDHDAATVMGSQTFGKGSVQQLIEIEDEGSSLKVTVARWLTPSGTSISDGGLTPDIVINRTNAQRISGEDPQLEAAKRFLNGEEVVSQDFEDQFTENGEDKDDDEVEDEG